MNNFAYGKDACKYFEKLYGKSDYGQFLRYDKVISNFKKYFRYTDCYLVSSSGRVEVVGNHTDHNGGKVIGCAVNLDVLGAFRPNGSRFVRIKSENHNVIEYCVDSDAPLKRGFALAHGVTEYLKRAGYAVGGFDLYTHSVLPSGAGVSSSASFEMLVATIINECFNGGAIPVEIMAEAGRHAERVCLDKPCGLLDQGSVLIGGMVAFDFADGFSFEKITSRAYGVKLALVDTGGSHSDLSQLYAAIPADMRDVAAYFGKQRLIDVDEQAFFAEFDNVCQTVGLGKANRAKHFFEENARVDEAVSALNRGDVGEIIRLVNESGDSSMNLLRNCSADENDMAIADAVAYARSLGAVGARVHGGGFAGTVLCVIPAVMYKSVYKALAERYGESNVLPMRIRGIGTTAL